MNMRWVRGCLVVVLVFLVPGTVLAAVSGLGFLATTNTAPEDVGISIYAPQQVLQVGDEYQIVIQVENLGEQTQFLDSVDFSDSHMEGIEIQSTDPPYTGIMVYPGFQAYVFERAIPPGDTLEVKVRATAVKAGEFPGWINVCINTVASCSVLQGAFMVAE